MNCSVLQMGRNCTACYIKLERDSYKHQRTVCKGCYKILLEKYKIKLVIQHQHHTFSGSDSKNNKRTLIVGPSFLGKTHMLKILTRLADRDFYIITKSPPEQYSNCKIKSKEMSNEIKPINEHENAIKVFDENLG